MLSDKDIKIKEKELLKEKKLFQTIKKCWNWKTKVAFNTLQNVHSKLWISYSE